MKILAPPARTLGLEVASISRKWRPNGHSRPSEMLLRPRPGHPFDFSWIWDVQGLDFEGPGGAQASIFEP